MSKKYYVVFLGHQPGVYESWAECMPQVNHYSGNLHKSYSSKEEAEEAYAQFVRSQVKKEKDFPMCEPNPDIHPQKPAKKAPQINVQSFVVLSLVIIVAIQALYLFGK